MILFFRRTTQLMIHGSRKKALLLGLAGRSFHPVAAMSSPAIPAQPLLPTGIRDSSTIGRQLRPRSYARCYDRDLWMWASPRFAVTDDQEAVMKRSGHTGGHNSGTPYPDLSPTRAHLESLGLPARDGSPPDLRTLTLKVLALWILRMRISTTRIMLMLAVTLLIGSMTIIAAGAVFAKIADDVVERDGVAGLDPRLSEWVVAHRPGQLLTLVEYLTTAADPPVLVVLAFLVGAWLARRRRSVVPLLMLLAASGGCVVIGSAMKLFVQRPRPPVDWQAVQESGFSFPSLHTLTATATFGMLAYLSPRAWPRLRRTAMWLLALGSAVVVGATRILLAVHWPSDVAASFALGTSWLAVLIVVDTVVMAVAARRPNDHGSIFVPSPEPHSDMIVHPAWPPPMPAQPPVEGR